MKLDQYERAALRRELSRWGAWEDKRQAFNGYPSSDNVQRSIMGAGGGLGGHRVLMLDLPPDVWTLHRKILDLPDEQRRVLYAIYVGIVMPDGSLLPYEIRIRRLDCKPHEARELENLAMVRLAGL